MPSPINSSGQNAAKQAGKAALSKSALGIFTLGALGLTAWRMQDSFVGSKQKADQQIAGLKTSNDYHTMEHNWGQWSGSPGMDGLTHKFQNLKQYGPLRLKEHYQAAKIQVSTFCGNVIMPNLLPLGVGLAGLYGTIGHKQMKKYGQDFAKWWSQSGFFSNHVKPTMQGVGKNLWKGIRKVVGTTLETAFKSPTHFAVASGAALVGAFFLKRFMDTANGDADREYYRDDIYSTHVGH